MLSHLPPVGRDADALPEACRSLGSLRPFHFARTGAGGAFRSSPRTTISRAHLHCIRTSSRGCRSGRPAGFLPPEPAGLPHSASEAGQHSRCRVADRDPSVIASVHVPIVARRRAPRTLRFMAGANANAR